jgi:hypothetical protein
MLEPGAVKQTGLTPFVWRPLDPLEFTDEARA